MIVVVKLTLFVLIARADGGIWGLVTTKEWVV